MLGLEGPKLIEKLNWIGTKYTRYSCATGNTPESFDVLFSSITCYMDGCSCRFLRWPQLWWILDTTDVGTNYCVNSKWSKKYRRNARIIKSFKYHLRIAIDAVSCSTTKKQVQNDKHKVDRFFKKFVLRFNYSLSLLFRNCCPWWLVAFGLSWT